MSSVLNKDKVTSWICEYKSGAWRFNYFQISEIYKADTQLLTMHIHVAQDMEKITQDVQKITHDVQTPK